MIPPISTPTVHFGEYQEVKSSNLSVRWIIRQEHVDTYQQQLKPFAAKVDQALENAGFDVGPDSSQVKVKLYWPQMEVRVQAAGDGVKTQVVDALERLGAKQVKKSAYEWQGQRLTVETFDEYAYQRGLPLTFIQAQVKRFLGKK